MVFSNFNQPFVVFFNQGKEASGQIGGIMECRAKLHSPGYVDVMESV
ncbi:hypothetical protein V6Z11_D02G193400 [Gossypium hirsutum]